MNPFALAIVVVFLAGGATALQAPTNARLASVAGSPVNAAFLSFVVGALVLGVAAAAMQARPDFTGMRALPWYVWLGGVYGACFVAAAAWGAPKLGVAMLISLMIGGQLVASLAIDHFGALGVPRHAVNPGRIAGVLLVLAGVYLVRRF
jgi:transporter family-2 protein